MSNYWLDIAAEEILRRYPQGEITVSSGISPSADYHIGHFREIMTAEALAWAIRRRGREARHLHIVDDFDPLRKRYDFLSADFDVYVGWPINLVPDPHGDCHSSYADHFYAEFKRHLEPMGIRPTIMRSASDLYGPGRMDRYIERSLERAGDVRAVFEEVSNRTLSADWTPVWVLDDTNRFVKGELSSWDRDARTISGHSYAAGRAKLDWRLDWPARWAELGVQVEPFGAQEHGAAGGSYDTGTRFARELFGIEPPYDAARYGHIHRGSETIKMSSSKGNGVTPAQALAIMPAELLRYFIARGRPERKLQFDPGTGLYNLVDEFAAASTDAYHEFRDAYAFAVDGRTERVISSVPFKHLVQVYQAARRQPDEALVILSRTGYAAQAEAERDTIVREFDFIRNWLDTHAPEEVVFTLQQTVSKSFLKSFHEARATDGQRGFLKGFHEAVSRAPDNVDGAAMHELIYQAKDEAGISPRDALQVLYGLILDKDQGPKAGWFLASLDRDWLLRRLRLEA